MELNKIYHGDFTTNTLPDKCANLIIADPPYFEVKGHFDFKWKSFDEYLEDVEKWAKECARILADNGTLFWYGDAKNIAYAQIILDKHLDLLNNLVWEKTDPQTKKGIDDFRIFCPVTERILMYASKSNPEQTNPFALELKKARLKKGVSIKQVAEYGKFYGNVNHGGAVSNWEVGNSVPSKEQWAILCKNLPIRKTNYEGIKSEYESIRRPFNNTQRLTDVLKFSQQTNVTRNYDHETKKPEHLTRTLIQVCSRPNDLVVVPFSGSGTECAMAAKEGRLFIGFDVENKYVEMSNNRVSAIMQQPTLFQEAWVANTNTRDVA